MNKDFQRVKKMKLLDPEQRWEQGVGHHAMSKRILEFLKEYDAKVCDYCFDWRCGGDGDNGEELMYELDAFFEMLDKEKINGES